MNIITCIKQVPASSNVEVDPITGVLIRDGSNVKMNPFDLYALEFAFRIKELSDNSLISTITMGPPQAKKALLEALHMGADNAYLLSDRSFAGADCLATSYALSQMVRRIGKFDLIICGKQTTDGDTAQVGPEIAEFLKIPHVSYASHITKMTDKSITVICHYDEYDEEIELDFPALITVDKADFAPRLPSFKRKKQFSDYQIKTFTLNDMEDKEKNNYGLNGSPTQVEEIFPPNKKKDSKLIKGDFKDLAEEFVEILTKNKFI
ncbi:MAG: electron transfer flavoprotein subunit beta/FixA family protein [Candidatus Izemoplasmatales bacterium]|nr:electron transfer flavoprotein subunit beta/FixA family protein [Candidatus Izemoplasmatales bacterium]MDY0139077.1 electron transfer flavoprotein subunit beta/FixA family protein [Candidatus Izemoplasmatales bacterium]